MSKNTKNSLFGALILLVALAPAALAGPRVTLLAPGPGDLAGDSLTAPAGLKTLAVPRDRVAVSWPLEADQPLAAPIPFVARSKEYFVEVSAADLRAGVAVLTSAPGALVRLNPAAGEKALSPIDPAALTLKDPAGNAFAAGSGMELVATAEQLRAAGAPFVEGTTAFRIRADLGAGTFELSGEVAAGRYVMHVLDRDSDAVLALGTLASDYLHGGQLRVEVDLEGAALSAVDGFVTSPAGRAWPVTFRADRNGVYRAALALDALEAPARGLWEAHVAADGRAAGFPVMRSARVAFNVAVPSARFDGAADLASGDALAVRLGVETAADGRYEARGVLYGSAADGSLRPIAVAHSAAWLAAGHGALELAFDRALVEASGLAMPFEIRDLRLVDQGTMGLLHRQTRGLVIAE